MASFTVELSEAEFQIQLCRFAENLGWDWVHVVTTGKGRHFPLRGPLANGFPDLILKRRDRMLFVELKKQSGALTYAQKLLLETLNEVPGIECYVWKPGDWEAIQEVLT